MLSKREMVHDFKTLFLRIKAFHRYQQTATTVRTDKNKKQKWRKIPQKKKKKKRKEKDTKLKKDRVLRSRR